MACLSAANLCCFSRALSARRVKKKRRVCDDCFEAFHSDHPWLCKYALANDMWLGRWCPLFRHANVSHQMLLALARIVTTKVVLRPEGHQRVQEQSENTWDPGVACSNIVNDFWTLYAERLRIGEACNFDWCWIMFWENSGAKYVVAVMYRQAGVSVQNGNTKHGQC